MCRYYENFVVIIKGDNCNFIISFAYYLFNLYNL